MKYRTHLVGLFIFFNSIAYGQYSSTYANPEKDVLFSIEKTKTQYIQKLIDSVGIAAPIPNEQLVKHLAYYTSYNPMHRVPNYVVHVIPKDILYGTATRTNNFRPDPQIRQNMSDSADYWYSGYDRGHMAASADFKWNKQALSESYYYSNIIPQNHELNSNAWNRLEMQIREWAIDNAELIVVTGPILNDSLPKIQQGSYKVSIPQYIYKIVLDYYPPEYKAIAFLYPNKNVPLELEKHVVSIDSIEKLTGIDFFPKLNDSLENILEAESDLFAFDSKYKKHQKESQPIITDYGKGKISAYQAKDFIGKETCVCGKVVSTKFVDNGKSNPTYINLDKKYPDQVFTLMIFGQDRANFSYQPEDFLKGKTICVKGRVEEYKGSPQIIANKEKQLEIVNP
ncbi:MAG TPA: DNA/RNA non-specific endonuclease [Chitinophagales bacterium]|jgi:endonuclease G|nr:DNA/RNA non-specific endonuclease [Chitinophagales bacterium]